MTKKPTYEELEQRVKELENEAFERKRAEEALRTSEAQLSNAMKIGQLGYWEYDVANDLFTFNDHLYAIFRTSAEKVGGYKMSSARYAQLFVHPDDMEVVGLETRKAIETTDPNYSRQLEHRMIHADGEIGYISVRFFIVKDNQGRTIKTYGANQDITDRKLAEETLRESEERYRTILESIEEAYFEVDIAGNFTFFNNSLSKILGYSSDQLVGMNNRDFMPPESSKKIYNLFNQMYITGNPSRKRAYEIIRKDGSHGFHEMSASLMKDRAGQPIGFRGIAHDITERTNAEEALRENEEKLNALLNATTDLAFLAESDGTFLAVNDALAKSLGRKKEELLGKPMFEFLSAEVAERRKATLQRIVASKKPVQGEDIREGRYFDNSAFPILDDNGNVKQIALFAKDITSRKQAEERLKISEQRLAQTINFLPDATFAIDTDGKVIAWNQAIEDMTGIKAQEMLGKGDYEYAIPFYGERRPVLIDIVGKWDKEIEKKYQYVKKEGESLVSETYGPLVKPDGFLWNKASLLYDHNGKVSGAIESIRDITDRKVADEALRESETRYRELAENAVLGIFQVTKGGKFLMANQGMANIFGYDSQQDFSANVDNIIKLYVNPEERPKILQEIDEKGHIDGREMNFKRKDGNPIFCNAYVRSIQSENGEYIYEGLLEDISDRKRAEEELQRAYDEMERRVEERTADLAGVNKNLEEEIIQRKHAWEELKKREQELETKTVELEETNVALNILLKKRERDKKEIGERVVSNVKMTVEPYLKKLKNRDLDHRQIMSIDLIESGLNDIISSFSVKLSSKYFGLTPGELQVAYLVKEGKRTKEIAELLNLSGKTIEDYRKNLRKKLGITNMKVNLTTHLLSIQ